MTLIEKEADCGEHASGRNSGVLHAGFYYTADSLKARLTRDGNRQLTEYCAERNLGINRCGKLVVAKNADELPVLDELLVRTTQGDIDTGYVINAAGLYADRVARDFGFAENYRILPFKGLYLYANDAAVPLKTNIYPVPDLRNPFLACIIQ